MSRENQMVEVSYRGRLGNQLFQYCFARIVAEQLGFELVAPAIEGFPNTGNTVAGLAFTDPVHKYVADDIPDLTQILSDPQPRKIVINAWLQRYDYYRSYRSSIVRWLDMARYRYRQKDRSLRPSHSDLVLNMRLGVDYDNNERSWVLAPSFFEKVIQFESFRRLFVCTDNPDHPLLKEFARYRPVVVHASPLEDFALLTGARKIALSTSTFSWWAAYLSNADRIYFPDTSRSKSNVWGPSYPQISLRVDDDERYIYLPASGLRDDGEAHG